MNATKNLTHLVDDLAGHWTEPALDILKDAGIRSISVDMELEAWRTLKKSPARRTSLATGISVFHARVVEHFDGAGASQGHTARGTEIRPCVN